MASPLISGVAFGAALVAAGVNHPAVIISQLKLENMHMLKVFLTGTATSGIIVWALQVARQTNFSPRQYSSLGLFAHFDGNVLGGALLGAGMAISGSCPGTVLAQVGSGVSSGFPALGGAILAGVVWSAFIQPRLQSLRPERTSDVETPPLTLEKLLGVQKGQARLIFELLLAATIALLLFVDQKPSQALVSPVVGGCLIGGAQLVSITLRQSMLGVSTAYEDAGKYCLSLCGGTRPGSKSIFFATGIVLGSCLLSVLSPTMIHDSIVDVSMAQSAFGGFLVIIGARIAGGCTSGSGISGSSILSVSSFITTASMLVAGIITAGWL